MNYWLLKSEPDVFGLDDLKQVKTEPWDGVRNYQARNMMRDDMKKGDLAFFYHSNCKVPGIAGIMKVVAESHPDELQFDKNSPYYDPKSQRDKPRWFCVDVAYERHLQRLISLQELKEVTDLEDLPLVRKGNRLSIMPVTQQQWQTILALE